MGPSWAALQEKSYRGKVPFIERSDLISLAHMSVCSATAPFQVCANAAGDGSWEMPGSSAPLLPAQSALRCSASCRIGP